MINLNLLRENPDKIINLIKLKDPSYDAKKLYELDQEVRKLNIHVEELRREKNEISDKARSGITNELREKSTLLSKELKNKEEELLKIKQQFNDLYLFCPNIPSEDIPHGGKESNKVVKTWGTKPEFNFEIKNHFELGKKLDWFDFEAAASMTGSRFVFYKKEAVYLIYALTNLMLKNNIKYGFEPVLPPYLVNEKSLEVASNFPKFRDQVYSIDEDELYLTPTAEVNLTNYFRDKIFSYQNLPMRLTAWTSCFRREAGTYGSAEHGLIRIHQFEKVELYTVSEPDKSDKEQELMLQCAENILQQLGLHYRVSLLAAQDCSFASQKTYDIEVWMPAHGAYYEVSSCSNCSDFQARRGAIRYKTEAGQNQLVNTLNCSSLALPRLIVALMETYQQPDGSIKLPDILKSYGIYNYI